MEDICVSSKHTIETRHELSTLIINETKTTKNVEKKQWKQMSKYKHDN